MGKPLTLLEKLTLRLQTLKPDMAYNLLVVTDEAGEIRGFGFKGEWEFEGKIEALPLDGGSQDGS